MPMARWHVRLSLGTAGSDRRRSLRIFFPFDPKRSAILLVGGDKTGDKRFYETNIPVADARYERHLERIRTAKVGKN